MKKEVFESNKDFPEFCKNCNQWEINHHLNEKFCHSEQWHLDRNHTGANMKTNADFETTDLTEKADIESWLNRHGICTHSNLKKNKCLSCGKPFESFEAACAERRDILDEYL